MLVYRLAHKINKLNDDVWEGPYQNSLGGFTNEMSIAHSDSDHPVPKEDCGLMDYDYYCGFDSLGKLYKWFEDWIEQLVDYRVYVYDTHDVIKGKRQVLFRPGRLVRTLLLDKN